MEADANKKKKEESIRILVDFIEENVLKKLDNYLNNSPTSYFSERNEPNAIDIIIHSEVSQLLALTCASDKLKSKNYPELAPWLLNMF